MWFGWFFGTLCLVGLVRTVSRRHRFYHHHAWAHRYGPPGLDFGYGEPWSQGFGRGPWGHGPWGHGPGNHGPGGHGFRGRGRGMLYSILNRLD
ncbi:MAG TPA: hypothetical protein VGL13_12075, partial [Polyangiaceae bacterium]